MYDEKGKGASARVLVAEDEAVVAKLLNKILTREGYEVELAVNGQEAMDKAASFKPDLIIMDIDMPKLNGYEAAAKIKESPELKDIPIVFLSGKAPNEDGGRAFCSGGLTYVCKPFTNWQITDLVNLTLQAVGKV